MKGRRYIDVTTLPFFYYICILSSLFLSVNKPQTTMRDFLPSFSPVHLSAPKGRKERLFFQCLYTLEVYTFVCAHPGSEHTVYQLHFLCEM